ncbi:MAG: hypothetical protein RLZZ447_865, partial [Verrucomicrobiota bacterium]
IRRPDEQEAVLRDLAVRCLPDSAATASRTSVPS